VIPNPVRTKSPILILLILFAFGGMVLNACTSTQEMNTPADHGRLQVVATTTFIGDVVGKIVGDAADLFVLLEPGQNPHSYLASPRDMVRISEADIIFANGLGLEDFLDDMAEGADIVEKIVVVSEGISGLIGVDDPDHAHVSDPHVWFDPGNVMLWVENIYKALVVKDPENAAQFLINADLYILELTELSDWIRVEIGKIPLENRKLVSDHISLGYFANAFGFEQIGAVIPASTTEAVTSGQQLAYLIETIRQNQPPAIFVGLDFDPRLPQQVADETGVKLVRLYFGSLTDGPPAGTYLDFMRYNVTEIRSALQE